MDETRILVIDEIIEVIGQVHLAVLDNITKNAHKNSQTRIKKGALMQYASSVATLRIIQKNALEELSKKTMMA